MIELPNKSSIAGSVEPKIIYDLGANNGINLDYYLKKADLVVAVEANPILVAEMQSRYADAISAKRLVIEPVVVTTSAQPTRSAPFYLHKKDHLLSQFPTPNVYNRTNFDVVSLPSRHLTKIVEQYDAEIFRALLCN